MAGLITTGVITVGVITVGAVCCSGISTTIGIVDGVGSGVGIIGVITTGSVGCSGWVTTGFVGVTTVIGGVIEVAHVVMTTGDNVVHVYTSGTSTGISFLLL